MISLAESNRYNADELILRNRIGYTDIEKYLAGNQRERGVGGEDKLGD